MHTINARLPCGVLFSAAAWVGGIEAAPKHNGRCFTQARASTDQARDSSLTRTMSRRKEPMADSSIVTLRLPKSLLQRADALIPALRSNSDIFVVGRLSRSVVLRLAVLRGLEAMEADTPIRASTTRAPAKKRAKR